MRHQTAQGSLIAQPSPAQRLRVRWRFFSLKTRRLLLLFLARTWLVQLHRSIRILHASREMAYVADVAGWISYARYDGHPCWPALSCPQFCKPSTLHPRTLLPMGTPSSYLPLASPTNTVSPLSAACSTIRPPLFSSPSGLTKYRTRTLCRRDKTDRPSNFPYIPRR